jgi:hypothetical protein
LAGIRNGTAAVAMVCHLDPTTNASPSQENVLMIPWDSKTITPNTSRTGSKTAAMDAQNTDTAAGTRLL